MSTRLSWEAHTTWSIHRVDMSDDASQFQLELEWAGHRQQCWLQSHRHQWIRQMCWEENELNKEKKSVCAAQHIILEQITVMTQYEESCSLFLLCQKQETESLLKKCSTLNQCNHIILNCELLTWQHTQTFFSCITVNCSLLIFSKIRLFLITWQ